MVWNRHFRPLLNVYVYQLTFVSIVRLIDPQAMASILITFSTVDLTLTDVYSPFTKGSFTGFLAIFLHFPPVSRYSGLFLNLSSPSLFAILDKFFRTMKGPSISRTGPGANSGWRREGGRRKLGNSLIFCLAFFSSGVIWPLFLQYRTEKW